MNVEAFGTAEGNDSWLITTNNVNGLICDLDSNTVIGGASMSFTMVACHKDIGEENCGALLPSP